MYYADLTPYAYTGPPLEGALNVGWLDRQHAFPTGEIPLDLLRKLECLAVLAPLNQMRGFHVCELCGREDVFVICRGRERQLGSAEIWVSDGIRKFASPDLIVHYASEHSYLPPKAYLEALSMMDVEALGLPERETEGLSLEEFAVTSAKEVNRHRK